MSTVDEAGVTREGTQQRPVKVAKFIQIASAQPWGQGIIMFALDEAGVVWQQIVGRENEWQPLPSKRGRPASP